jgi:L-lactate dehydrogenase (cytochrome)
LIARRFPRPRDLAPLLVFKKPDLNAKRRRLQAALTIYDLCEIAKRRTPQAPFDYADGAAEAELSIAPARQAFEDIEFHPSILQGVTTISTSRSVLGGPSQLPIAIAPTGFTRMMHTEGEIAGSQAASKFGIPFTFFTMGTASVESLRVLNPRGRLWFQLSMLRGRERSMELVERAKNASYDTLLVTADVPVAAARLRDKRNGMSIPPELTLSTIFTAIPHPEWWINFLTTEPLTFASLSHWSGTVRGVDRFDVRPQHHFRGSEMDARDLARQTRCQRGAIPHRRGRISQIRCRWRRLIQSRRTPTRSSPIPFQLLPQVAKEVGTDLEILIDTGIMSGADVVATIAMGARSTLVGRAYLYGLMAGGQDGVERTLQILSDQLFRTMRLLGVADIEELNPSHVTQMRRLFPIAVD